MDILNPDEFYRIWSERIMADEYATLRSAFHAGATIQAYTVENDDGSSPMWRVEKLGYWRDLCNLGAEPKFTCHPSRYQVKDHHPADAPVALEVFTDYFVKNYPGPHTIISDPNWHAPKIFRAARRAILQNDPEASALRSEVVGANERAQLLFDAKSHWADRARAAEATVARVRALADRWIDGNETCPNEKGCTWCKAREEHADELRAELEGYNEGQ